MKLNLTLVLALTLSSSMLTLGTPLPQPGFFDKAGKKVANLFTSEKRILEDAQFQRDRAMVEEQKRTGKVVYRDDTDPRGWRTEPDHIPKISLEREGAIGPYQPPNRGGRAASGAPAPAAAPDYDRAAHSRASGLGGGHAYPPPPPYLQHAYPDPYAVGRNPYAQSASGYDAHAGSYHAPPPPQYAGGYGGYPPERGYGSYGWTHHHEGPPGDRLTSEHASNSPQHGESTERVGWFW